MNVKDNHKPMNLFIINDYENFLYGHDSSVQTTRNFYKSLSIWTKTTSNVLLFLCSLEGGL